MTIEREQKEDLATILEDDDRITRALERAARQAILEHKEEGLPLALWRDGRVVWVPAEELEAELADDGGGGSLEQ